ncbi:hypothetical protein FBU59_006775, partial [Linderina macrospora]
MSYKNITFDKSDEELYREFIAHMMQEDVIAAAIEGEYEGEFKDLINEKLAADLSPIGHIFGDNDSLSATRHRAMVIRSKIDPEIRALCKDLDGKIKYDLSEEDKAAIEEEGVADEDIEDEIYVRPFCMYDVDIKHLYKRDLTALPKEGPEFVKLALNHEMDCLYEDSDEEDEEWEDEEDDEDDEDEEDDEEEAEIDEAELKALAEAVGKGKGKAAAEEAEEEEHDHDEEHEHGEDCGCAHDVIDLNEELPFDEDEVEMADAEKGLQLLKEHRSAVVAELEKIAGASIDTFKTFHIPGRHYVVGWLEGFGIFGIRISYPILVDGGSDDEVEDV